MNAGDDEPSSGLNGRLRPRKSNPSPKNKSRTKSEGRIALDKPKRATNPSKASPNKQDDLPNKSDFTHTPYFLCPFCDKKFASKQTLTKHIQRMHYSKPDAFLRCLFCNESQADSGIIQHMVDNHPDQYFACLDCRTRLLTSSELAEHKENACEKLKVSYRTKLRQKEPRGIKKIKKSHHIEEKDDFNKDSQEEHGFNGVVISCELKPSEDQDGADIEDNITTNLILPPNKNLGNNAIIKKSAVIVLDELQWNKKIPSNFSFHNTDADQILSRLGVVHRSPRTGESTKKDWFKTIDDTKFEKCFDTKFYSQVASNVQENLAKFLDGTCNFNPDPDSTIKTRKSKNNAVINTAEGFPILLAREQYSRNVNDGYMPRAIAPKHKWKWDSPESDKGPLNPDQIKRDSHTNNCIITLISSLDIWTQLSMRRKFDIIFNRAPIEKKTEKQNIISQELKEILESREIPKSPLQIVKRTDKPATITSAPEFPACLGLAPAGPTYDMQPALLSGEWVRPRCYVCCACGEQTSESKGLSSHISNQHPNANVQYYEIVGEPLLNADILKHLYVPPSQVCNRTRPPRGFRECTKCQKSVTLEDLHQHMLDCAGDTPAVRRRQCRYRPFGVRRRRTRMPDNTIRKKMRKDIRSQQRRQKSHMRPRPRPRTEVGDAETIRKMLADLPAKRHRVVVNPVNMIQRPRRILDKTRPKMIMKKNSQGVKNIKQCGNKRILSDRKAKSVSTDTAKQSSNFDDDEDNKPLRPKLKSIINKTRQRETIKRQSVVKRAKRKSIRVEQRNVDSTDKVIEGSSEAMENASLDETPHRIDVKRGSYTTRDHGNRSASGGGNRSGSSNGNRSGSNNGNRSASGNRDGQRPSCSGTNGNANNSCAPAQNVPLKHSIARLTANSETHDKSVQFHHSFLVQQECNNTDQHVPVPTGQHTLFENEAVVTRLDKPPLNFCQKRYLDLNALQKNKLNKPRKGLNDCIAMLKNKLVDPLPQDTPGHVSVQCGNDDPIDLDPRPLIQASIHKDAAVNVDLQPSLIHSTPVPRTLVEFHPDPEKIKLQPEHVLETLPKVKQTEVVGKRKSPRGKSYEHEMMPPKTIPLGTELNISRQKQTETYFYGKSPVKTRSRSDTRRSSHDSRQQVMIPQNDLNKLLPADIEISRKKSSKVAPETKVDWQKASVVSKHLDIYPENVTLKNLPENRQEITNHHMRQDVRHEQDVRHDNIQDVRHEKVQEVRREFRQEVRHDNIQAVRHDARRDVGHDTRPEVGRDVTQEVLHDIRQEVRHDIRQDIRQEIAQEIDLTSQTSLNIYPGSNMLDIPTNIPPAHASTNVESIISTPLDLSSKVLIPGHSKGFSCQDAAYMNYDSGETLDLSNKTYDNNCVYDESEGDDVIVDLSVKPTQAMPLESSTLDLCVKSNNGNILPDVFTNSHISDNYPTDLSVKSKETGLLHIIDRRSIDASVIQDFSVSKTFYTDDVPKNMCANKEKIHPPDLSGQIMTRSAPRLASDTKGNNFVGSADLTDPAINKAGTTPGDLSHTITESTVTQDMVRLKDVPNLTQKVSALQQEAVQAKPMLNLTQSVSAVLQGGVVQKPAPHSTKTRKVSVPQLDVVQPNTTPNLSQNVSAVPEVGAQLKSATHLSQTLKVCAPKQDSVQAKSALNLIPNVSGILYDGEQKPEQHSIHQGSQDDTRLKSATHLPGKISITQQDLAPLHSALHLTSKVTSMYKDNAQLKSSSQSTSLSSTVEHDDAQVNPMPSLTQKVSAIKQDDAQLKSVGNLSSKVDPKQDNVSIHPISKLTQKENATNKDDVPLKLTQHLNQKESIDNREEKQKVNDAQQDGAQLKSSAKECDTKPDEITNQDKTASERSAHTQKPVYDPTLKIPQYKIRSTESMSEGLIGDSADPVTFIDKAVASPNISQNASVRPHDNLPYIYGSNTVPMHAFSNRAMTASLSRMESTTPVYTLAKACITVTKIESSSSATLTNTLLSIPGSTIASTTPVYTLTGTTIGAPAKIGAIHETEMHNTSVSYNYLPTGASSDPNRTDNESGFINPIKEVHNDPTSNHCSKVDEDPETARKIAMLPKELVDILGNMPVDHRNQLLNVLPQYVSSTAASTSSYDAARSLAKSTTPLLISVESPSSGEEVVINDKMSGLSAHQNIPDILHVSSAPSTLQNLHNDISVASVQKSHIYKEEPINIDSENNKQPSCDVITDRDNIPEGLKYQDRIIDLTGDETLPGVIAKVTDVPPTKTYQETPACPKLEIQKNKRNNDKTASLRAVRIKAPAERQKESQMLKRASIDQKSSQVVLKSNDDEVNKLLEVTKSVQDHVVGQIADIIDSQDDKKDLVQATDVKTTTAMEKCAMVVITCPKGTDADSGESITPPDLIKNNTTAPESAMSPTFAPGLVTLKSNLLSENTGSKALANTESTIDVPKILIPDIETTSPTEKSILPQELEPKAITEDSFKQDVIAKEEIVAIHDEEDSEDDIILAAIAKQKKNKRRPCATVNIPAKKKKKEKKSKKLGKKERVNKKIDAKEESSNKMKAGDPIVEVIKLAKSQSGEDENLNFTTFDNNNSRRSEKNEVECNVVEENIQERSIHIDFDKNKENSIKVSHNTSKQQVDEKSSQEDMTMKSLEEDKQKIVISEAESDHLSAQGTENKNSDIPKINPNEIEMSTLVQEQKDCVYNKSKNLKSKKTRQKAKSRQRKKQSEVLIPLTDKNAMNQDESFCEEAIKKDENNLSENSTVHKNTNINMHTTDDSKDLKEEVQNYKEQNENENLDPVEAIIKLDCTKATVKNLLFTNIDKNLVGSDLPTVIETDVNLSVPLRRSRRGKSLFVDSNVTEQIISNTESTDYRGPLTKKQLIFSKLLLDEENHTKISKQAPEKEVTDVIVDFDARTVEDSGSGITGEDTYTDQAAVEPCKLLKRKKSPQSKRKCKKKKSVEIPDILNDDSQTDTKTPADNSAETQTKCMDQLNVIEKQQPEFDDLLKEDQNVAKSSDSVDDVSHIIESDNTTSAINEKAEEEVPETNNSINKSENSIEKRKITHMTNDVEDGQYSKPKKAKFNKSLETITSDSQDNVEINTSQAPINPIESEVRLTPETRSVACYNLPVAARRTRSKSVVVKSSSAQFYDPYDIDMDDMIENSEPLKKPESKTKAGKSKSRYFSKISDLKTSGIIDPVANVDNTDTSEKNKKKTKKNKQDTIEKGMPGSLQLKSVGKKAAKALIKDPVDTKIKYVSDSDESSKSDVPLKKYVDDKVKKKTDIENTQAAEKEISDDRIKRNKGKQIKKKKRTTVVNNDDKSLDASHESEEQLRSEQFMESFGFFSERKPRKSNLLASKKISETFHIIANDSDDMYYPSKERTSKRTHTDNKKSIAEDSSSHSPAKRTFKRGQKKKEDKVPVKPLPRYCSSCKKEFKRPDNYVRHQLTLMHIARLSEIELQGGIIPDYDEEPSYVIERRKKIRRRMKKNKKRNKNQPKNEQPSLLSLDDILEVVDRSTRPQQLAGLSRDEALFVDCCELLKESRNRYVQNKIIFPESDPVFNQLNHFAITTCCHRLYTQPSPIPDFDFFDNIEKTDKSDGDVDSITAKNILESEEVRNLENDLISGLQEAANSNNKALCTIVEPHEICSANFSSSSFAEPQLPEKTNEKINENINEKTNENTNEDPVEQETLIEQEENKVKKYPEVKEKMYPDIEEFDMFEDKFDKIKRKCRSQAAAAKQAQAVIKAATGHRQKKSEKKKGKKISKKNYQNTVLTKGALKGFDGIKVSIPTSDINMSAIVPSQENSPKKKKKTTSKKKREKKYSETSSKYDSDHRLKDSSSQKKVDVYEFMDNEDAELFEFRPSTLMERFKSISNKDTPGTSKDKHQSRAEEREQSCGSVSDGDDFVYMSDDYVCSEDETENSMLSCELGNGKTDLKKTSLKRKDVIEKNAVMGKIFKHNAVRSEKKITKLKETVKPKANLDQLFDSLLEDEPNSSMLNKDSDSSKREEFQSEDDALSKYETSKSYDLDSPNIDVSKDDRQIIPTSPERYSTPIPSLTTKKVDSDYKSMTSKYDILNRYDYPSTSKTDLCDFYGPSTSKMADEMMAREYRSNKRLDSSFSKNRDTSPQYYSLSIDDHEISERKEKSSVKKSEESYDFTAEFEDDAGVARQRARRKCTVGKQNVLAETWSSESEPDGAPARCTSAESIAAGAGRKKKGKKREGQQSFGRRGKASFKKQEIESRVSFGSRHTSGSSRGGSGVQESSGRVSPAEAGPSGMSHGGAGGSGVPMPALHVLAPRVRRTAASFWTSESEDKPDKQPQHGWIVGPSHKKLVTMLAHAKGRKRNNDDERHLIE